MNKELNKTRQMNIYEIQINGKISIDEPINPDT